MLLSIALISFFLILLLLLIPVDLVGQAAPGRRQEISLVWLFGLIKIDLQPQIGTGNGPSEKKAGIDKKAGIGKKGGREKTIHPRPPIETSQEKAQEEGRKEAREEAERKSRGWSLQDALSILQTEGLKDNLKLLLRGMARAIRISYFRASLYIGLEDPADTGLIAACLWSAAGYLQSLYPIEIDIQPSFCQERLDGEGCAALRIWPAFLLLALLRFALSRPSLSASLRIVKMLSRKRQKA